MVGRRRGGAGVTECLDPASFLVVGASGRRPYPLLGHRWMCGVWTRRSHFGPMTGGGGPWSRWPAKTIHSPPQKCTGAHATTGIAPGPITSDNKRHVKRACASGFRVMRYSVNALHVVGPSLYPIVACNFIGFIVFATAFPDTLSPFEGFIRDRGCSCGECEKRMD